MDRVKKEEIDGSIAPYFRGRYKRRATPVSTRILSWSSFLFFPLKSWHISKREGHTAAMMCTDGFRGTRRKGQTEECVYFPRVGRFQNPFQVPNSSLESRTRVDEPGSRLEKG